MRNNKGFTLAELLIVVAIVAVLVSIAVPMFWIQLEKSREKNDVSNARSAYSEVRTCAITGSTEGFDVSFDGVNYTKSFRIEQTRSGWYITDDDHKIKGLDEKGEPEPHARCVVSCTRDGDGMVYWNGIPNSYLVGTSWSYTGGSGYGTGTGGTLMQNSVSSAWTKRVTAIDKPLGAVMNSKVYVSVPDDPALKGYHYGMFFVIPGDNTIINDISEHSFDQPSAFYTVLDGRGGAQGYTGDVEVYIQLISPEGTSAPDEETSKKLFDLFYVE